MIIFVEDIHDSNLVRRRTVDVDILQYALVIFYLNDHKNIVVIHL